MSDDELMDELVERGWLWLAETPANIAREYDICDDCARQVIQIVANRVGHAFAVALESEIRRVIEEIRG